MATERHPKHGEEGYEHADANVRSLYQFGAVLAILIVAVMWAMPSASTTFLTRFAPAAFACAIYFFSKGFFLPAMARRGPFLVRALVCVRWPRTGRFFR